jgi:hypothetical protein
VQTVVEASENDERNSVESVGGKKWAASSEAHTSSYTSDPALLRFESGNEVEKSMSSIDQPDSSGHVGIANSNSVLPQKVDNVNDDIAAKHNASYDVTVARSRLRVLSNSDPDLLRSWEIESARKRQAVSSPDVPLSSSVPNLMLLCENGKSRKRNGFTLVKLKSKVYGWKTDCETIFSSLPSLFKTGNSSDHSRYKHISESEVSKKKLSWEEDVFKAPKSHNVIAPTDQHCLTVDIPSPVVILRSPGTAETQSIRPQEQVEATNRPSLCDIEWSFPESRKKPCSHIAKFVLNSPLNNDRQQLPHLSRPRSSPAHLCKSVQQLRILC